MPILEKVCFSLYLAPIGPYLVPIGPYLIPIGPYLALLRPIWSYWALFGPIGPYLALTVKQKRDTEGPDRGHRTHVILLSWQCWRENLHVMGQARLLAYSPPNPTN